MKGWVLGTKFTFLVILGLANVSGITLASFNTNGLGDFAKRSNFITHVNSMKVDLVVFVDTRLDEIKGRNLENEADSLNGFSHTA